ncbi:hydrogenase maturation protease [Desulfococcus sp.]|uniref:hydrogenase maturation protease n=1 Tax=Desulfococcus sp. TaxID=2025834 RepID=UPI0035947FF9
MLREIYQKKCLVFGCGNPLIGDDGFGPEVIRHLEGAAPLPDEVACLDVGTSIRDILFDFLLVEKKPELIVIVDAMEVPGAAAGEIFEIDVADISPAKICDFSLHQFPTTNMLKEIQDQTDIDVRVFVVQTTGLPSMVSPGLSNPVAAAVPVMCSRIRDLIRERFADSASEGPS